MRGKLVAHVRELMAQAGFAVSDILSHRPISFDFLGRRDDQFYIVKVLTNIDSLSSEIASEMKTLARFLDGRPLLVGLKASSAPLEAGAVYVRHGIPILSVHGLEEYLLEGAPPVAIAAPGGFCVRLDSERLHQLRIDRNLSLGQLADVAGVSRRAISMYEDGMSATVEAAIRLEEFLEEELIRPVDPFSRFEPEEQETDPSGIDQITDPFTRQIFQALSRMGFGIVPTGRSPFQGIGIVDPARYDPRETRDALLLTASADDRTAQARGQQLSSVSMISERTAVFIVSDERKGPRGTAFLGRKELSDVEDAEDLRDLVQDRREED